MYPFTVKAVYVKKCNQLYRLIAKDCIEKKKCNQWYHLKADNCRDKRTYQRGEVYAVNAFYRDSIVKSVLFIW